MSKGLGLQRKGSTLTTHNNIFPEMIPGTQSYILSKRIEDGKIFLSKTVNNKSIQKNSERWRRVNPSVIRFDWKYESTIPDKSTLPNKSTSTHCIGVDLIWSYHAIMLCQRNGIGLFTYFLMGNDRCIHLSLVESRRKWETYLLLFVLLLIWICNWYQTYTLVPSVVPLILWLAAGLLVGNFWEAH